MVDNPARLLLGPGPSPVDPRITAAMGEPVISHVDPVFGRTLRETAGLLRKVFGTANEITFAVSGTGFSGMETALINIIEPDDTVIVGISGFFGVKAQEICERMGAGTVVASSGFGRPVETEDVVEALDANPGAKAVFVVAAETSAGLRQPLADIAEACHARGALLVADMVTLLGGAEVKADEWGVDVTVAGSQKGLMLPPGLSFNAISDRALAAAAGSTMPRAYWDWSAMSGPNEHGFFPYTPATNLLYGLAEAIDMLNEEGLDNVFARHDRLAAATRAAVNAWGLEILCREPRHHSSTLTAVQMPKGVDADAFRQTVLERYNLSLGNGLSKVAGRVFRIGHLGDFNELMLLGTLGGVEMGLGIAGVPHRAGGVQAAMAALA